MSASSSSTFSPWSGFCSKLEEDSKEYVATEPRPTLRLEHLAAAVGPRLPAAALQPLPTWPPYPSAAEAQRLCKAAGNVRSTPLKADEQQREHHDLSQCWAGLMRDYEMLKEREACLDEGLKELVQHEKASRGWRRHHEENKQELKKMIDDLNAVQSEMHMTYRAVQYQVVTRLPVGFDMEEPSDVVDRQAQSRAELLERHSKLSAKWKSIQQRERSFLSSREGLVARMADDIIWRRTALRLQLQAHKERQRHILASQATDQHRGMRRDARDAGESRLAQAEESKYSQQQTFRRLVRSPGLQSRRAGHDDKAEQQHRGTPEEAEEETADGPHGRKSDAVFEPPSRHEPGSVAFDFQEGRFRPRPATTRQPLEENKGSCAPHAAGVWGGMRRSPSCVSSSMWGQLVSVKPAVRGVEESDKEAGPAKREESDLDDMRQEPLVGAVAASSDPLAPGLPASRYPGAAELLGCFPPPQAPVEPLARTHQLQPSGVHAGMAGKRKRAHTPWNI
eukprot:GHVT01008622.1.p1 GENE.GHVT01008622.1~~GHVT01008622.1.p1  ORF type:complete len:507 (+),score=135.57 GHVT01008622.1:1086-2606(+)